MTYKHSYKCVGSLIIICNALPGLAVNLSAYNGGCLIYNNGCLIYNNGYNPPYKSPNQKNHEVGGF